MFTDEKKHGEVVIDEVGQAMLNAADYIEKHGHCKNTLWTAKGEVCLVGAFIRVGADKDMAAFDRCITRMGFPGAWGAVYWNNAPERTAQEVIDRLRQFA